MYDLAVTSPDPVSGAFGGNEFNDLGLRPEIVGTLQELGYRSPTPIQKAAIPPLLDGQDVLGQAATGTGKTAAFALPLVQRLAGARSRPGLPRALVLVPTRELAMQVTAAFQRYGAAFRLSALAVYGGQSYELQIRALRRGVDILVATPGRATDHLERGTFSLAAVETVVLDEADEMLDVGFLEDIERILAKTPVERQVALFSATLPQRIKQVAERHQKNPQKLQVKSNPAREGTSPSLIQAAYLVPRGKKVAALCRMLAMEEPKAALVFCRTRIETDELAESLNKQGQAAEALHGGLSQTQRERVLKKLREGSVNIVIATDVAARGLDIECLSHVVNFDVPASTETYVHRIGRVGRAGREGRAISLVDSRDQRKLKDLERVTSQKIAILPLPTAADLRKKRLQATAEAVKAALQGGGLESFQSLVEALAAESSLMEVALAAFKALHGNEPSDLLQNLDVAGSTASSSEPRGGKKKHQGKAARVNADMVRLFVGAGRDAGVRPQDLVGAITGEAGIRGYEVGAIQIAERFSLVEVAAGQARSVVKALAQTKLKGRRVVVKLDEKR